MLLSYTIRHLPLHHATKAFKQHAIHPLQPSDRYSNNLASPSQLNLKPQRRLLNSLLIIIIIVITLLNQLPTTSRLPLLLSPRRARPHIRPRKPHARCDLSSIPPLQIQTLKQRTDLRTHEIDRRGGDLEVEFRGEG